MGIDKFIKKVCVQDAVYWGNPVSNGTGGMTFDAPVDIKCRWTDKQRIILSANGVQVLVKGEVMITADLDLQGWLKLGRLSDFDSTVDETNPMKVAGAYEIIAVDKIPMIKSTTVFVRTVFFGFGSQ